MSPLSALLAALDRCGGEWDSRRIWCVEPLPDPSLDEAIPLEGPGLFLRWNPRGQQVIASPISGGRPHTSCTHVRWLAITCGREELVICRKDAPAFPLRNAHVVETVRPLVAACLAAGSWHPRWVRSLRGTAAAMNLLATLRLALSELGRQAGSAATKHDSLPEMLHHWLSAHLHEPVQIQQAAAHFKLSPRHLTRLLEQKTGLGFSKHLMIAKVLKARDRLMRSDEAIADLAGPCGFQGREQFIRTFRDWTGWTPLQFRKAYDRGRSGKAKLAPLCQLGPRREVEFLARPPVGPPAQPDAPNFTLVVANAGHEVLEVFLITASGAEHRVAVLAEGEMWFLPAAPAGSLWRLRRHAGPEAPCFLMPEAHAIARPG